MDNQELHNLLEQLHGEIDKIDSLDEKGREILRLIDKEINDLLIRTEGTSAPLVQSLQSAIEHLEMSHPRLTATMSQLFNVLNQAGI
jgi:translation elongation factor EF-Tu-like GTPase